MFEGVSGYEELPGVEYDAVADAGFGSALSSVLARCGGGKERSRRNCPLFSSTSAGIDTKAARR